MSHTVTVTRTVTTGTTTAVLFHTGYLKSGSGFLKVCEVILGIVCVGIVGHYFSYFRGQYYGKEAIFKPELFFLLVAVTCLITTALLLFSCLFSIGSATILPRTLFESLYHGSATFLYLAASLTLLIVVMENRRFIVDYEPRVAGAVIGLVTTILYLVSFILSIRTYRNQ